MRWLLVLTLVALLGIMGTTAVFADETAHDCTQINAEFVGQKVVGTLCEDYTFNTAMEIVNEDWTFTGQVNGQPANASGSLTGRYDVASGSWVGQISSFKEWNMGTATNTGLLGQFGYSFNAGDAFAAPRIPLPVTIKSNAPSSGRLNSPIVASALAQTAEGGTAWLTLGLRKAGDISFPFRLTGDGYTATSAKLPGPKAGNRTFTFTNIAGLQPIKGLPRTGEGFDWITPFAFALLLAGAASLTGATVVWRRAA